jgi:hypothetical protein
MKPAPYANPYLAGVGLGLVLTCAYAIAGRGLGASGAFASAAAGVVHAVAPAQGTANGYFSRYLQPGVSPWSDWLVLELAGVCVGGWLSARLAGRTRLAIERGPSAGIPSRLAMAGGGGSAMGLGAVLARGCTSGQALTGGALLSVGSWLFMIAAFASAYMFSPLIRRFWR